MGPSSARRVGQYAYEYQRSRSARGDAEPANTSAQQQHELSARWASQWRPRGMQSGRYLHRAGHGTDDPHRALAQLTDRDVDAEDAGQQTHPPEPMPGHIAELLLERWGGDVRQFNMPIRGTQAPAQRPAPAPDRRSRPRRCVA